MGAIQRRPETPIQINDDYDLQRHDENSLNGNDENPAVVLFLQARDGQRGAQASPGKQCSDYSYYKDTNRQ